MQILRKFQLEIIFLFFAALILLGSYFLLLMALGRDPHQYEWYLAAPLLIGYFAILWHIREKINRHDRRGFNGVSLVYWVILGLILFLSRQTPLPAIDYWSVEFLFVTFTLFLADSYWDFRKLTLENLFGR